MSKTAAETDKKSVTKTPKTGKKGETAVSPDTPLAQAADGTAPKAAKTTKAKAAKPKPANGDPSPLASASVAIIRDGVVVSRDERVRHAAYLLAEARGFAPGREVEDWLAAEAEVDGKPATT